MGCQMICSERFGGNLHTTLLRRSETLRMRLWTVPDTFPWLWSSIKIPWQVRGLHWASRGSCEISYTNKPLGERHTESPGLRAGLGLAGSVSRAVSPQKPPQGSAGLGLLGLGYPVRALSRAVQNH